MAGLEALPEELLVRLITSLERSDLARIRLVNHRLRRVATEQLFRSITLYAHWIGEDEDEDDTHSVDSERDATWIWNGGDELSQVSVSVGDGDIRTDELHNTQSFISSVSTVNVSGQGLIPSLEQEDDQSTSREEEIPTHFDLQDDFEAGSDGSGETIDSRPEASSLQRQAPKWARKRIPGPPGSKAQSFRNCLLHSGIRHTVQEVQVYTCETHCVSTYPQLSLSCY